VTTLAKDTSSGTAVALSVMVEITGHPGAKLVGPLPKELQVPLLYSAVLGARPLDEAAASTFDPPSFRAMYADNMASPDARQNDDGIVKLPVRRVRFPASYIEHIRAGRLRALAVTSTTPLECCQQSRL